MSNRNNQEREIQEIMRRRSKERNNRARRMFNNTNSKMNEIRNDNDIDIVERNRLLRQQERERRFREIRNSANNQNFMETINQNYFLTDEAAAPAAGEGINMMNANGNVNEIIDDEVNTNRKNLKEKALELEMLIVERLARNRLEDAKKLFNVLERMYRKFKDDNVKDVYFRVLQSLPDDFDTKHTIYSYRQDKNNFQEVLRHMNISNRVKAVNEDNPCINAMGDMWDECDLNICSEKCKENILKAAKESKKQECKDINTGYDHIENKPIKLKDDIKKLVLERLSFCKRVADFKKENPNSITYKDDIDLKNHMIREIREHANIINIHYSDCYTLASEYVNIDQDTKRIIELLKEIDYTALSLDRLTELRNFLQLLPSCDKLRYDDQQERRDENIKNGERVGKFIIPKNTEFHKQLQGKEKAHIYKDIASEKQYLYDPYTKTITGLQYPMTSKTLLNKSLQDDSFLIPSESDELMANSYDEELKLTPVLSEETSTPPSPVESEVEVPEPVISEENNIQYVAPVQTVAEEKEEIIIFNLTLKNILEYMFLVLIILIILFVFGLLL